MQLNTAQLAHVILERRRTTPSPSIQSGTLVALVGQQGLSEALSRRWLVADISGYGGLSITGEASRIQEMFEAMTDPVSMDTGDQIQYVGRDGRTYVGVVRNVTPDKTKASIAFTQGNPPDYHDGAEYDTRDIKVTKKTLPDARLNTNTNTPSTPPTPAGPPTDNTYSGLSH